MFRFYIKKLKLSTPFRSFVLPTLIDKRILEVVFVCHLGVKDDEERLAEFFTQMKTLYPRYDTPKRMELRYYKNDK